ncbi:ABC transporter permease [Desulfobulbus alkaliphilus]|uniref:ABC transporter permease n=1 Tax=Desulfobulbus alkaliphilus TaxID=869814 RepID=UPI0019630857|nr:ABC-2 family transporter protein [Desulfobulbus alkaliphilus]MBM9535991.1 ABC-2 family transporter protein [Desulfobulbus alkaliphilus]
MSIMRTLLLVLRFMGVHMKTMLLYRTNFFVGLTSQIIYTVLSLSFVGAFLAGGRVINGWDFGRIIFLLGFGDVAFGLSAIFLFRIFVGFEQTYIIHGGLDKLLVQPLCILFNLMLRNMDLNQGAVVIKGIVVMLIGAQLSGTVWTTALVLLVAVLALSGAMVYCAVYVAFLTLGFWFRRRNSLVGPMLSMNYLVQYPLSIYPTPLQVFLTLFIPLGLATYYPARAFLEIQEDGALINLAWWPLPLLGLCSLVLASVVFHVGLRNYASSGT